MVESYTQDLTEWFVYLMCQDLEDIVYKDQHLVGGKQLKKFVYTFFIRQEKHVLKYIFLYVTQMI